MNRLFIHRLMPVLAALFYAVLVLPLPLVLLDHDSEMMTGEPEHSSVDEHAWLEWAAGSSMSGATLFLALVSLPTAPITILSVQIFSILLASALRSRGPPVAV